MTVTYLLRGFVLLPPKIVLELGGFSCAQLCSAVMDLGGIQAAYPTVFREVECVGVELCVGDDVRVQVLRIETELGVEAVAYAPIRPPPEVNDEVFHFTGRDQLDYMKLHDLLESQGEYTIDICMRNVSEDPVECYVRLPRVGHEHRYGSFVFNSVNFDTEPHYVHLPPGESLHGTMTVYSDDRAEGMRDGMSRFPVLIQGFICDHS